MVLPPSLVLRIDTPGLSFPLTSRMTILLSTLHLMVLPTVFLVMVPMVVLPVWVLGCPVTMPLLVWSQGKRVRKVRGGGLRRQRWGEWRVGIDPPSHSILFYFKVTSLGSIWAERDSVFSLPSSCSELAVNGLGATNATLTHRLQYGKMRHHWNRRRLWHHGIAAQPGTQD